jgi:Microcystin-dependent protein
MEGVMGFTTMFAGNFAPKAWQFCQGQVLAISSNTALYSLLGTTYGGNGQTTFGLPNLMGRCIVGAGTGPGLSPYRLGQSGGAETVTLTSAQMPMHAHPMQVTITQSCLNDTGNESSPDGGIYAGNGAGYSSGANARMLPYTAALTMTNTGADSPYEILPPYLAVNYIICVQGVFPARN